MKKDCLNYIKVFLEIVLIGCTIVFGSILAFSIKDKEIKLETLKVAIGILHGSPGKDDPLREWAIDVFEKYADSKPSEEVKKTLREKSLGKYLMGEDGHYITDSDGNRITGE